jgi:glycosyltransferase involved in cell wall biosynthesis
MCTSHFGGVRIEKRDGFLIRLVNRLLTVGTAGWIVNADCNRQVAARDFGARGEKVFIVPNGIRPEDFCSNLTVNQARVKFGLLRDIGVVTMVANLRPEKNHAMFFRLARRMVQADGQMVFVLAGDGPEMGRLQSLCQRMGLSAYVRFLGRCQDVSDLLRPTDVVPH